MNGMDGMNAAILVPILLLGSDDKKMPRLQQDYGICSLSIVEGFFGKHNGWRSNYRIPRIYSRL